MIKTLKLYHYSQVDFKGLIRPGFFGKNCYTRNSERESGLNRTFFYLGKGKEYFLNGSKFCYIAEIEKFKLYDLIKDEKKLLEKWTFDKVLGYIKNLGYWGVIGNNCFNVVCLFRAIKYIDKRTLTKAGKYVIFKITRGF